MYERRHDFNVDSELLLNSATEIPDLDDSSKNLTPLEYYIRESVSKTLLSAEEEQDLADSMKNQYDQIKEILNSVPDDSPLKQLLQTEWENNLRQQKRLNFIANNLDNESFSQTKKLSILVSINKIKQSAKILVEKNLRLVVSSAKKKLQHTLPQNLNDLIQEGNIGLTKAAIRYAPRNIKFSTYASHWIDVGINNSIKNNEIYLPSTTSRLNNITSSIYIDLQKELKKNPNVDELKEKMESLGYSADFLKEVQQNIFDIFITQTNSLENPTGTEDDNASLKDSIADSTIVQQEEVIANKDLQEKINDLMNCGLLKNREILIIYLKFGLNLDKVAKEFGFPVEKKEHTCKEIADYFGLSTQRIQVILKCSYKKLREAKKRNQSVREYYI